MSKIPTGAVQIDGRYFLLDPKGKWTPVDHIAARDLIAHELVHETLDYAEDLAAEVARFKSHAVGGIGAYDALLDQEYGVKAPGGAKGNRTLTTYDGARMIKVAVADRIQLGPELQAAKTLLDELVRERGAGGDPIMMTLVNKAFALDEEGKIDVPAIMALARLEVPDERWPNIQRAIRDSVRVVGTKPYLRFYRRNEAGKYDLIPIDIAAAELTPDAAARRSVRRRAEEAEAALGALTEAYAEQGRRHSAEYDLLARGYDFTIRRIEGLLGRPMETELFAGVGRLLDLLGAESGALVAEAFGLPAGEA
ncbi:MAG: DUF3164 family protein [Alphaproteobacteria bacterium]|nr:DUF3164 family protein [Alphaproteobacteria bacterium]